MNSRQRVEAALNHQQPDLVPLDLGASPVTGMHVSSVYQLRQALGLDPPGTPVKVVEPYQMLGEIDPELQNALGVDVVGLGGPRTMFGFENQDWKPWTLSDGTPVLVPGGFQHPARAQRRHPHVSRGRPRRAAQRPDAQGRILLRHDRPPGADRRRPSSTSRTISKSSARSPTATWHYFASEAERLRESSPRAILANFGGTAFGDIALVPAPWLKHPKGIRDVEEWYVSTAARFDYVYEVFRRQCEIALANLAKIYDAVGDRVTAVFVTGTDFGTQSGPFISPNAYRKLYQPFHRRVNDWVHQHTPWKTFIHSCGSVIGAVAGHHRGRLRHPQPGAVFGGRHGPADAQGSFRREDHLLGRRRGHAEDAALRHAGRGPRRGQASGSRFSAAAAASSSTRSTTCRPARRRRICWPSTRPSGSIEGCKGRVGRAQRAPPTGFA